MDDTTQRLAIIVSMMGHVLPEAVPTDDAIQLARMIEPLTVAAGVNTVAGLELAGMIAATAYVHGQADWARDNWA